MDKKEALIYALVLVAGIMMPWHSTFGQTPARLEFCDRSYNYGIGNDSITLYFKVFDQDDNRLSTLTPEDINRFLVVEENGNALMHYDISRVGSGVCVPRDYTFSILLDQSIPAEGKEQILDAVKQFIAMTPDSCVYVSFYGDEVSNSELVTAANFDELGRKFLIGSDGKTFYSGVYAKMAEFIDSPISYSDVKAEDYHANESLAGRVSADLGKNILMVFAEGGRRPDDEEIDIDWVEKLQWQYGTKLPKVYAFYYTADGEEPHIETTLELIAKPKDADSNLIPGLQGDVNSSANMDEVVAQFKKAVSDAAYDYALVYTPADEDAKYMGSVGYMAKWGNNNSPVIGEGTFTIGSAERPWPEREQSAGNVAVEYLIAVLVTLLTFAFFFLVMKIVVPYIRFLSFKSKYYKKYEPEANVQRRICHYCKQDLRPGQVIVTKCKHWMHKHCWEENGYKCAEFGQNCKIGIQEHIEWKELLKLSSLKDCSQTIAGVLAGLVSWIIYEICGRGGFEGLSKAIVGFAFGTSDARSSLVQDCEVRTSSFLMIGLLLGFFISLVFRYKDDIRDKTWKIWLKIVGLSVLTGAIGMIAFGIGADIFCMIVSWTKATYIPWYCSLPAYVLFSLSVSLALTIQSTIPVKSALWGGLISSVIGFLVLYFTRFTGGKYEWLNMLLDFIIYGGGLGASLVTVRMLAEKYFLVIQNGVKAGQRIPIHKWMNATGGGNKVSIGMTGDCEIQMNWEKSNKVAKEHAQLYIDHEKTLPVIKPLATGVVYNSRAELPINRAAILANGDTFKIGDTIFKYEEA